MLSPVKSAAVNIAQAKKVFGYDCSMCHGKMATGMAIWRMTKSRVQS